MMQGSSGYTRPGCGQNAAAGLATGKVDTEHDMGYCDLVDEKASHQAKIPNGANNGVWHFFMLGGSVQAKDGSRGRLSKVSRRILDT